MIIYKLRINASLKGSKAVSAPRLASGYCSLLEGVLVPRSICIFAINGIFCFDRHGTAKQSDTTNTKRSSMHHCFVCLFVQQAAFDFFTLVLFFIVECCLCLEAQHSNTDQIFLCFPGISSEQKYLVSGVKMQVHCHSRPGASVLKKSCICLCSVSL